MISTKERLKNILQSVQNCNKTSTDDDLSSEGDFFQEPGKKEKRSLKSACTVRVFLAFVKFFISIGVWLVREKNRKKSNRICYSPAGRSVLGKTVPEVLSTAQGRRPRAVLKTEGISYLSARSSDQRTSLLKNTT